MRYLVWSIILVGLVACGQHNEIQELNRVAKLCVGHQTGQCQSLRKRIALLHDLTLALQTSPQGFGLSVLRIQEQIASLKKERLNVTSQTQTLSQEKRLVAKIKNLETAYREHLTVIRWFESPNA